VTTVVIDGEEGMFFNVAWIDLNGAQETRDWDFAD